MPFPKEAKSREQIKQELYGESLDAYEGIELCLNSFESKTVGEIGDCYILHCQTEDGTEVKLSTFSKVVADILENIAPTLPAIIMPTKHPGKFGDYWDII